MSEEAILAIGVRRRGRRAGRDHHATNGTDEIAVVAGLTEDEVAPDLTTIVTTWTEQSCLGWGRIRVKLFGGCHTMTSGLARYNNGVSSDVRVGIAGRRVQQESELSKFGQFLEGDRAILAGAATAMEVVA